MKKIIQFLLRNHTQILTIFTLVQNKNTKALIIYLINWASELSDEELKQNDDYVQNLEQQKNRQLEKEEIQRLVNM